MKIYGLRNCDTCRKAEKALRGKGLDAELVDVRLTALSSDQLSVLWAAFGEKLLNQRSTTWRGLSEDEKTQDPLALIQQYPALMKRPVIDDNGALYLGWGKDVQGALL